MSKRSCAIANTCSFEFKHVRLTICLWLCVRAIVSTTHTFMKLGARSVGGDSTRKQAGDASNCALSRRRLNAHTSLARTQVRVQSAATQRARKPGTHTGARSVGGDSTRTQACNAHRCAFSRRRLNAHASLARTQVRVQSAATQRARKHVRVESAATQRARKRGTHTGARSIGGDITRTHDWCPCTRLVVTALRKAHNASAQMRVQSLAADHVHAVCACAFARVQSP